ncbi:hypothetical protein Barb4_03226 [Bacteroidales bacterium Barb4]|nr:hypothetical protein Barb4_03226 [Bacteroidales bacterium Barb4]
MLFSFFHIVFVSRPKHSNGAKLMNNRCHTSKIKKPPIAVTGGFYAGNPSGGLYNLILIPRYKLEPPTLTGMNCGVTFEII